MNILEAFEINEIKEVVSPGGHEYKVGALRSQGSVSMTAVIGQWSVKEEPLKIEFSLDAKDGHTLVCDYENNRYISRLPDKIRGKKWHVVATEVDG